ncbi:putative tRNA pseudouridine synthase Pus10 [Uranotaenia lowii]|uniref:putative tRNA pseudouridine synthase Pus10 n=1 Tax=Uranotaenia lowii TaxID=190385 RepID=UPI002478B57D|nr:putative tRNA pseudouridine synthase Pus10 [Uranotaenia lowii]
MPEDSDIYHHLRAANCCRICCLRFLNGRTDDFINVEAALLKRKISTSDTNLSEELNQPSKKLKENCCVACLGLFEPDIMQSIVDQVKASSDFKEYDCQGFSSSIYLPIVLHLRQLSLWLSLLEQFPNHYQKDSPAPDVSVKDAFRMILNRRLEQSLEREFSVEGVTVNVFFNYANEERDLKVLENVKPEVFSHRKTNKHTRKEFITRNAFEKHFTPESINLNRYKQHIPVPPEVSDECLVLDKISFRGPTLFLAGRYNKISRELSQTPWVIEGKRKMENSVQEIIAEVIAPFYRVPCDSLIFSSSGREDVDVRCLGEGRPFVLEIPNAFKDYLDEETAVVMETSIGKTEQVAVKDLQLVPREELVYIKHGEEEKRKFYRALCVLEQPVTEQVLKSLNIEEPFQIEQWTPLRVLHRRPLLPRPRTIHSVKAMACAQNDLLVVIDVVTQAGTYIKELVHGDFGRSTPSFRSIIGQPIDIHALDVMAIDLDWPKRLRR